MACVERNKWILDPWQQFWESSKEKFSKQILRQTKTHYMKIMWWNFEEKYLRTDAVQHQRWMFQSLFTIYTNIHKSLHSLTWEPLERKEKLLLALAASWNTDGQGLLPGTPRQGPLRHYQYLAVPGRASELPSDHTVWSGKIYEMCGQKRKIN